MKPGEIFRSSMMDTSVDDADREWCYLAKSTTVIGVPFQPDVTQVTFDGALFTKHAELCFFYGMNLKPLFARQKTFLEGWIPAVVYDWKDGDLHYDIEMFAAQLDGEDESNTVNFIRVNIINTGTNCVKAKFTSALRNIGKDYRFKGLDFSEGAVSKYIGMEFSEDWVYGMTNNKVIRDNKLVYTFSPCSFKEAVSGEIYREEFCGKKHNIKEDSEACLVHYEKELTQGDRATFIFKMPRVPVGLNQNEIIKKIDKADYNTYRNKTINYWKELIKKGAAFSIPEKRVQDAMNASLVHLLLATRTREGKRIQTDGLPYPNFFLTSFPQMALAYLNTGHADYVKYNILNAVSQQEEDGLYFDKSLAHGGIIPTAHGHTMYAVAMYCLVSRDMDTAVTIYSSIKNAVGYIEKSISEDEFGLLPPTYSYDNEMIDGHYTSNNIWTLLGLRYAIRLARMLGEMKDADSWILLEKNYLQNIMKGIEASTDVDGYVPTGLYPFLTGKSTSRGFEEYQTNCDWENMLLSYPTEILKPDDYRVKGSLSRIRLGYEEGIMTYRHGMHLHQYITANLIEQYMVRGEAYTALKDFYHLLLHCGSTHEGFENLVKPWTDRHVEEECPAPHAWAAAKIVFLTRNLLVHEFGGQAGIFPEERDLYLFSVLSPEWALPGQEISFKNAPTEMGTLSASLKFSDKGACLRISGKFHTPPRSLRIRIPYFKELTDFTTDAHEYSVENNCITLSPDASMLQISWKDKDEAHIGTYEEILKAYRSTNSFEGVDDRYCPIIRKGEQFIENDEIRTSPQPLSFKLVLEAFRHEYERRCLEFTAQGGSLTKVEAPVMSKTN